MLIQTKIRENCIIDFKESVLINDGFPYSLSRNEVLILQKLISNIGLIVKYDELIDNLHYSVGRNNLSVYISKLRKKIEMNPKIPRHLISIKGIGYLFITSTGL